MIALFDILLLDGFENIELIERLVGVIGLYPRYLLEIYPIMLLR